MQEFNYTNLTEEEVQELNTYQYNSDLTLENAIERIKEINNEIERLEELGKQKIQQIKDTVDAKVSKLSKKKEWDMFNLASVIDNDTTIKATKTQKKKEFLSGTVVRKFASEKMIKPELTEEVIVEKFNDYKKEKTVVELDWAELKKTLEIKNGKVFNKYGELVEVVKVESVPAKTEIK